MIDEGIKVAQGLFQNIIGLQPTRVELGVGSFITFDFGKDIPEEVKTRTGKEIMYFGEWHLWVYMCAWRIELSGKPWVSSDDDRELIRDKIAVLSDKKVLQVSVLNETFDLLVQFESGYELKLFSIAIIEDKQWLFYTPNKKVFSAGPGSAWSYE